MKFLFVIYKTVFLYKWIYKFLAVCLFQLISTRLDRFWLYLHWQVADVIWSNLGNIYFSNQPRLEV